MHVQTTHPDLTSRSFTGRPPSCCRVRRFAARPVSRQDLVPVLQTGDRAGASVAAAPHGSVAAAAPEPARASREDPAGRAAGARGRCRGGPAGRLPGRRPRGVLVRPFRRRSAAEPAGSVRDSCPRSLSHACRLRSPSPAGQHRRSWCSRHRPPSVAATAPVNAANHEPGPARAAAVVWSGAFPAGRSAYETSSREGWQRRVAGWVGCAVTPPACSRLTFLGSCRRR
jgi:hypothetical protein